MAAVKNNTSVVGSKKVASTTTQSKQLNPSSDTSSSAQIAVILIRGKINLYKDVKNTLNRLNLERKNNCVLLPDTPIVRGMLRRVKDVVTWGPVSQEIARKVASRRPVKPKDVSFKSYSLSPPRGGFERGGIKQPVTLGGVLGERESMDDLLSRMV